MEKEFEEFDESLPRVHDEELFFFRTNLPARGNYQRRAEADWKTKLHILEVKNVLEVKKGKLDPDVVPPIRTMRAKEVFAILSGYIAVAANRSRLNYVTTEYGKLMALERLSLADPSPRASLSTDAFSVASFYERRLAEKAKTLNTMANEGKVREACANRNLLSALMDHDWLGLKILATLRKAEKLTASELVSALGEQFNTVASSIAELAKGDVIKIFADAFAISPRGETLLSSVEKNTGVSLQP
jgi:hypothetical protein